jgi:hydrogenase expression/formation protein HypC
MCLGIPGRILDLGEAPLYFGRVAFGEVTKQVSMALVPGAQPGDFVIVHAGTALEIIDEAAAARTWEALSHLDSPGEDTP